MALRPLAAALPCRPLVELQNGLQRVCLLVAACLIAQQVGAPFRAFWARLGHGSKAQNLAVVCCGAEPPM